MRGWRLLGASAFACATLLSTSATSGVASRRAHSPTVEDTLELRIGGTARTEGTQLSLTFEEVTHDSRCPVDVTCVRAGEAIVVLAVRENGGDAGDVTLRVPPRGSATATFGRYVIDIVTLEPQTQSAKRIEENEYVASIRVSVSPEWSGTVPRHVTFSG